MKVLITGGAGFIGSHLCDRFLADGHDVICVDNLITGTAQNVAHLKGNAKFRFIEHNIATALEIDGPLDAVLHFASPASPPDYLKYPIPTLKVGSLGTLNALGIAKAKHARFLLASTSEVYGDPQVHPQPETYWGHVNPVGPRGVYDEAKRFAEAMTMAYHREHGMDTKIVRIFNSILADETVILFNDLDIHVESIETYANRLGSRLELDPPKIIVPTFDPTSCRVLLAEVSALIKHPCQTDCYQLSLRYGRRVKVTGDHSVFVPGPQGQPVAKPVRELRVGDHVAIPSRLPVVERDIERIDLVNKLIQFLPESQLWGYVVQSPTLKPLILQQRETIHAFLARSGRFQAKRLRNALVCATNKYLHESMLPLPVFRRLGLTTPRDGRVRVYNAGAHIWLPALIEITSELLWLLGFFLAEGCAHVQRGKSAFLSMCSNTEFLDRAGSIAERLGCHVVRVPPTSSRGPAIVVHSQVLHFLFDRVFDVVAQRRFPAWIMQLPLGRLKHVLEGFREGDGTHSGKKLGKELCFDTASEPLATDLTYLLLRFGIVASVGRYQTTFRKRYGDRRFPFFRVTICEVNTFDILKWDQGVQQTLNARRTGDLVWSKIKQIERCEPSPFVYDFSVPGKENFVAGNGVFCHNTYGPRMRLNDGRAIPNFVWQALKGEPITVFGDGSQTRSFCYVDDLVEGIVRLLNSTQHEPVNLGNPEEWTILQLAKEVLRLVNGHAGKIEFRSLPTDDPKQRRPDITKAKTMLGWEPRVPFKDGLPKTIAWFRSTELARR